MGRCLSVQSRLGVLKFKILLFQAGKWKSCHAQNCEGEASTACCAGAECSMRRSAMMLLIRDMCHCSRKHVSKRFSPKKMFLTRHVYGHAVSSFSEQVTIGGV